ncbi:MAG: MBL fold metallo-hydrolase [Gammaproteobacteria bacterium]|nr:MBL fold metallo-hydrolase [Gammaproteobacteria bacterium]
MRKLLLIVPLLVVGLFANTGIAQEAKRAITKITGDVYRFQNNFHFSVFTITGNGVVVTDPINAEAAAWLKAEIGKLTEQPITHLVYSHSHGDHASGGAAFGDVPNVVAHANAPAAIDGVAPTMRFSDQMTFTQGGKQFALTYLGPGHGVDLIAMVIRPENVGFVVDAASAKRLPYRDFPGSNVDDWTNQVRKIETLDFEIFAGGHGAMGIKADATTARVYMEELRAKVLAGLKAGKSVDDLVQSVTMAEYRDWASYEQWRGLNVQGMARFLKESGAAQ